LGGKPKDLGSNPNVLQKYGADAMEAIFTCNEVFFGSIPTRSTGSLYFFSTFIIFIINRISEWDLKYNI
jgi:hypothetical protein